MHIITHAITVIVATEPDMVHVLPALLRADALR